MQTQCEQAAHMKIDQPAVLDSTPQPLLPQQQAEQWKTENRAAIVAYNDVLEENGCFGDEYRSF